MAIQDINIIGKKISQLCAVSSINPEDLLIISYRINDVTPEAYKSKKITFGDFTKKFEADIEKYIMSISAELSTRVEELFIHIDQVSSQVKFEIECIRDDAISSVYEISSSAISDINDIKASAISGIYEISSSAISSVTKISSDAISGVTDISSSAISNITTISSEVTEKVKDLSGSVEEMSAIVEYAKSELWKCAALSTLNHFTFIGDDINKLPEISGHLSSVSSDILWFDTTDDETAHQLITTKRIDNLQAQIYTLGMQVKDFYKVLENGVIPGNAYNSTKDEMIKITDIVFPPDESIAQSQELLEMYLYGNYYCKNKENYYLMFNPAGFYPLSTNFRWSFYDHDKGNEKQKTFLYISSDQGSEQKSYNYLIVELNDNILSSTAQVSFSALVKYDPTEPKLSDFLSDQYIIDNVIKLLSSENKNKMTINVSSDYYLQQFNEYVSSDYEVELNVGTNEKPVAVMDIIGNDYIDYSTMYFSRVNELDAKQPLNLNINWYFLSSYIDEEYQTHIVKSDKIVKKFIKDDKSEMPIYGYAIYNIFRNIGTPFCYVSVQLSDCTYEESKKAKDLSVELYCESLYNNQISACKKIIGLGGVVPNTEEVEPTVKAVCAKYDIKQNFIEKKTSMRNGEIVYFKDTDQLAVYKSSDDKFMTLNSSSSSGLSKEEIQDIGLDYLTFTKDPKGEILSKILFTNDGKMHSIQKSKNDIKGIYEYDSTWGVYVSNLLQIGKTYSGGKGYNFLTDVVKGNKQPKSIVSHNFVELVNASDSDIVLDRIYLMYHTIDPDYYKKDDDSGNSQWQFIKLQGIIKAHGTFLIRGAECNPCGNNIIKVNNCDLEWRKRKKSDLDILNGICSKCTRSGDLMEFSPNEGTFFLIYATIDKDGNGYGQNVQSVIEGKKTPVDMVDSKDTSNAGYIDLNGLQSSESYAVPTNFYQGNAFVSPKGTLYNLIVSSWFYMDPSRQGNKKRTARDNYLHLTGIDLERHKKIYSDELQTTKRDNFYYEDDYKIKFTPQTSENNDYAIFRCRSSFSDNKPNIINITFGIQATDASNNGGKKASRCFNWISTGYHDEYIKYRKVNVSENGTKTYGEYIKEYSITEINNESHISAFHEFYDRIRWFSTDGKLLTTHKVILKNCLEKGLYEFFIGRDDDSLYVSDTIEFEVKSNDDVKNFSFIQTSDQQGFNWIEYQAWKASCRTIKRCEGNFDFTINTGDIAQSGNRHNEWIDYYDGKKYFGNIVEMFTIGNNDLCGTPTHVLGDGEDNTSKFNLINILYYYTFELDVDNQPYGYFKYDEAKPEKKYPLYSLYSFNYGDWHFISLVSEIRKYYATVFSELLPTQQEPFANKLNSDVETWFKRDLALYMNNTGKTDCSKCIVYMHEMPFTMVTPDFFDLKDEYWGNVGRSTPLTGCKLNLENQFGEYRFSRLFRKAGIRIVIGGHKHTFSLSNPLYDCSEDHLIPDGNYSISADKENEDPFISSDVTIKLSHKPFIEMPIRGVQRYVEDKVINEIQELIGYDITQEDFDGISSIVERARDNVANQSQYNSIIKELFLSTRTLNLDSFNDIDQDYSRLSDFIRILFVTELSSPTYVMSQATGYKVVSNKELPSALDDSTHICRYTPWLMSYCAAFSSVKKTEKSSSGNFTSKTNTVQCRPTYVRYDFSENNISVCIKQVDGIYVIQGTDYASYTLENQLNILSCYPLTFGKYGKDIKSKWFQPTTLSTYMSIYSDYINGDTYVIKI